ncbi:response regulator transcription factor [Bacteroidota bacterium]
MKKILVVEDEELIRMALEDDLSLEGYLIDSAEDGLTGYEKAKNSDVDLIILDVMLPEMNGFDVCRKLRMDGIKTPIIMLTAKGQEIDRVLGLEMGADDYVTKPFSPRELQARIKALFRTIDFVTADPIKNVYEIRDLKIDFLQYECYKNGELINLTKHEFDLLKCLINNGERVIDRNELLDKVWGVDIIVSPRTIDTHLANLRKKIEDDPADPRIILSVRGVGYKIGS